jgi:hypothetical protein
MLNSSKRFFRLAAITVAVSSSIGTIAEYATAQEAAQSGKDLTVAGAEQNGNKDGTIPVFQGSETAPAGWAPGKVRGDFWKYKGEKPLLTIDATNVDKYAAQLTPGQIKLVKQTTGYKMNVYPTHRTCGFPDWIAANSRKNLTQAKIGEDGWSIQNAILPGIPFAKPRLGVEAIWNYMVRYRGVGIDQPAYYTSVSPRTEGADWIDALSAGSVMFPWGKHGETTPKDVHGVLMGQYWGVSSPPALAGYASTVRYYFDKSNDAYFYFPGQRRVRRLPSFGYDAAQIGTENQYTADEQWMFSGTPDRFDWKITGKKEILVPYNDFGMLDFKAATRDVLQAKFPANDRRRYELHRVWVVEATVKAGMRHSAPKKVFYFDEDSWLLLVGEDYDAQGKLWKVREGFPVPVWELGSCDSEPFVQYDLNNGRYVADNIVAGTGHDLKWMTDETDPRLNEDYYGAENLRSLSER